MCRALADCFTFPIQSKVEEWKATIKMIDREHARNLESSPLCGLDGSLLKGTVRTERIYMRVVPCSVVVPLDRP
jgi:hypothetical protein